MTGTFLTISSKNYSSWSLRGYLLVRLAGLAFEERVVDPDDPTNRKELLLQSSSIRVPALMHDDVVIWDTPDFMSGGGSMPMEVQAVASKDGTAVFSAVTKNPVYVSAAFDPTGKWDAQSGPPPSGLTSRPYGANMA